VKFIKLIISRFGESVKQVELLYTDQRKANWHKVFEKPVIHKFENTHITQQFHS
jgi:hypothetical protein